MAAEEFKFKLITPLGVAVDEQVQYVLLPTQAGEIGVLPGHVNYSGALAEGSAEYIPKQDSTTKKFKIIGGGIAQCVAGALTVLADGVEQK